MDALAVALAVSAIMVVVFGDVGESTADASVLSAAIEAPPARVGVTLRDMMK